MPRFLCVVSVFALIFLACGASSAEPKLPWPDPDIKKVDAYKAELKKNLDESFAISKIGPWVVATDMEAEDARHILDVTIRHCAAGIQRQLFTLKARSEPAKVYLFKDGDSYGKWNQQIFGQKPISPYGYFSRAHNSLVMNIGTGGGTLIHEMVHAMAEADYPDIPAWLNEGLGSLYEACGTSPAGKVVGVTNWRLKGLQDDLKNNTETQLNKLIGMSDTEFYGERSGSNYAAARYFMQWLQEQGKLEAFYVRVRDKKDAGPKEALRSVFENKMTLDEIHKKCFDWAKGLVLQR